MLEMLERQRNTSKYCVSGDFPNYSPPPNGDFHNAKKNNFGGFS